MKLLSWQRIDLLLDLAAKELDKSNERKLSSAQCNPWPASAQGSAAPGSAAPGQQESVEQGPSRTRLPPLHHLLQLSHPSHGLMSAQTSVLNDLRTSGETSVLGDRRDSADAAASAASVKGGDSIAERGVEALGVSQGHLQQAAVQNSQMAGGDSIAERGFEALRAAQQAAVQTSQIAALTTALQALVGQMSTLQEKQASIEKQIHEMQQQMIELSRGVERTQPLPPGPHTTTQQRGA